MPKFLSLSEDKRAELLSKLEKGDRVIHIYGWRSENHRVETLKNKTKTMLIVDDNYRFRINTGDEIGAEKGTTSYIIPYDQEFINEREDLKKLKESQEEAVGLSIGYIYHCNQSELNSLIELFKTKLYQS